MTEERKRARKWHLIIVVMMVGAYAGTYAVIVKKNRLADPYMRPPNVPVYTNRSPMTSSLNGNLSMFFTPAHFIDRWIRPDYWGIDGSPTSRPSSFHTLPSP